MQNNIVELVWVCFIVCSEGHIKLQLNLLKNKITAAFTNVQKY